MAKARKVVSVSDARRSSEDLKRGSEGSTLGAEEERRRRARVDQAASAGLAEGRLDLEVLWLLPSEFVVQYEKLFARAFRDPGLTTTSGIDVEKVQAAGTDPKARRRWRRDMVEKSLDRVDEMVRLRDGDVGLTKEERLALAKEMVRGDVELGNVGAKARSSGRRHREHWTVTDERAFEIKRRVDRTLAKLARDIRDGLEGSEPRRSGERCSECGRYL